MLKRLGIFLVIGIMAFALAACGGDDNNGNGGNGGSSNGGGGGETVDISMTEMAFDPSDITVPAGEVTFNVTNDGTVHHDFVIEALDFSLTADPGESDSGSITLEPGTYEFICTEPGHAAAGMTGTLTVE